MKQTRLRGYGLAMAVLILLPAIVPAQQAPASVSDEELELYTALNERETRLPEFKDDGDALLLKLRQLHYINANRLRNGAGTIELDILASRVANRMARESAENGVIGHWNMRGEKPYHRWAFAGGRDHISENAGALSSTGKLDAGLTAAEKMMKTLHDSFMAEKPPADGHRKTVLAPEHTAVGIGFAIIGKEGRYYEEYLDRYLEFLNVPDPMKPGDGATIKVRPISNRFLVQAVMVFYEPPLKPLDPSMKRVSRSYADFAGDPVIELWPWELPMNADGTWTIPFAAGREGLYYVHIYLGTEPFRSGRFSTEGKIQASGIVIRVGK